MIDEIFDRQYRTGRAELNMTLLDAVRNLGKSVSDAFKVLNRIEYSAPWAAKSRRLRSH